MMWEREGKEKGGEMAKTEQKGKGKGRGGRAKEGEN